MKPFRLIILAALATAFTCYSGGITAYDYPNIKREKLSRGLVAVRESKDSVALTWRYLSDDDENITFDLYRDGIKINKSPITTNTFFKERFRDKGNAAVYELRSSPDGELIDSYTLKGNSPCGYIEIPLNVPASGITPAGETYTYSANDASIGDVDGDGNYEIILKWDPSNAHDNAHDGYTGNVLIDCYKLDGQQLWRIDLGKNIRAGAHYTQFMVYDLDGDNKAEVVMKTADGTVDGAGNVIGNPDADYREAGDTTQPSGGDFPPGDPRGLPKAGDPPRNQGRILSGHEYLTVFNGLTGEAMETVAYIPPRGILESWGDNRANRADRFLAGVGYLDGKRPSVIMCRGYYTRSVLAAYDWDGTKLTTRWVFDSDWPGNEAYAGQGNHNLRILDIDGDGCDEIIYGQMAIDHNGRGLYSTGMYHGDAIHVTSFMPRDNNLQVWACHENRKDGSSFRDALTGEVLWQVKKHKDVGRCMAADIDPTNPGLEMWSSDPKSFSADDGSGGIRNYKGEVINPDQSTLSINAAVWWDGDLLRELLDHNAISKYDWDEGKCYEIIRFEGCASNNGTKGNACLSGDIVGDWREEVLMRTTNSSSLRLYVSTIATPYRFHTFLEDIPYRLGLTMQNVAYNQPPHPGFYFGADFYAGDKVRGTIIGQNNSDASKNIPKPVADTNGVTDNTPDSISYSRTARPVAGSTRAGNNPVLFLVGNSTMRTGTRGNGDNGQWGWGYFAPEYFDPSKITVENHALGGMSSRTFYNLLWNDVLKGIRKGDWVAIELGHNDNGPYDSGRARASIPGIGNDSLRVTIRETGVTESVYSYGEYLRRFVHDIKKKGATPILLSLTPRNAWEDADSTVLSRVNHTYGLWARQVAENENVPFIDLNEITAEKYEHFGKEKVKTMFYLDRIHTSEFGARVNAQSFAEGIKANRRLSRLNEMLAIEESDTITGKSRNGDKPVVFIIGDSTVKNQEKDSTGMWGWGSVFHEFIDSSKATVENHAMAGRSARTFLDEGRWDKIYNSLNKGDFVLIQFGHNDIGDINTGKARGELPGGGDESRVFMMERTGRNQVVYTYGWYLRKFVTDAKEKGAIPVIISPTPRFIFDNGKIESNSQSLGKWAKEAAEITGAEYVDLNTLTGGKLQHISDLKGLKEVGRYFLNDHTHTSLAGAQMNAKSVTEGLKANQSPLTQYIK